MDKSQGVTHLILKIGGLEIYSVQNIEEYNAGLPPAMFYYTDQRFLQEWKGPFHTVYNATDHYNKHLKLFKQTYKTSTGNDYVNKAPTPNVIMVNFITRAKHKLEDI